MLARSIGMALLDEMIGDAVSGTCASGSAASAMGWRRGVVPAAGVPAGESVTAGISDTRRLCPGAVMDAPRLGDATGGTGSRSAAVMSIVGAEAVVGAGVSDVVVGLLLIITVITLPSLMS